MTCAQHPSWKHLLLPCNGALLWIILLGTSKFQNTQSKIQSPTLKLLVCIVDVGISEVWILEIYRTDLGCYLVNPSGHASPRWGIIVFKTRSKVLLCWMLSIWQDKDGMRTDDINALAGQRADKKPGAPGRQPS